MLALQIAFWTACGLVAYAYVGYPMLLGVLARVTPRRAPQNAEPGAWPTVSLIISAYKEEALILQRIANALQMDYPADRLEIIIGCDGNEDCTGDLVRTVDDSRVHLRQFPQRRGKPSVLNDCVADAQGEIIAFSDANTFWEPDALKKLVRHFQQSQVGGVCGQLLLTDPATGKNADGLYWKYENFLKRWEGRIGALLGFNGAIYAIRKSLWEPIPAFAIVDDFLIGMRIYQRQHTLVFEEAAVANEETAPSIQAEFQRRTRIGAGGFQSLCWLSPLLSPKYGRVAWAFWSHKVLRWLCPLFMVVALATNIALAGEPGYGWLLVAQATFYGVAISGNRVDGIGPVAKLFRLCAMFAGMNAALAVGFWRWLGKQQTGAWARTARSQELATPVPAKAEERTSVLV
ncbi:glycosyltransferase family 2 protein [Planctomicrobium piriforme]|uniref:Glycosyltransferase, catalytic subunit of cellulose synthase and poly-beta-1,6-N-acetylglucosamine synthase n=1 Tax=Planctomicrobium piriforme TaxID=1576369 RepID=A0A1I3GV08_9PLAN|nr:glycosyltransferase family 2 protein [Planctomicrobium piriforme]SFI27201.1 Glycosyltransferase, catalytic subunit of cellulose synthase and poly-beta-1,6-N-acetylglucosamine synthase [Planctomicrobium piriforme]